MKFINKIQGDNVYIYTNCFDELKKINNKNITKIEIFSYTKDKYYIGFAIIVNSEKMYNNVGAEREQIKKIVKQINKDFSQITLKEALKKGVK